MLKGTVKRYVVNGNKGYNPGEVMPIADQAEFDQLVANGTIDKDAPKQGADANSRKTKAELDKEVDERQKQKTELEEKQRKEGKAGKLDTGEISNVATTSNIAMDASNVSLQSGKKE